MESNNAIRKFNREVSIFTYVSAIRRQRDWLRRRKSGQLGVVHVVAAEIQRRSCAAQAAERYATGRRVRLIQFENDAVRADVAPSDVQLERTLDRYALEETMIAVGELDEIAVETARVKRELSFARLRRIVDLFAVVRSGRCQYQTDVVFVLKDR